MTGVEGGVRIALLAAAVVLTALTLVAAIFDSEGAAIFCGVLAGFAVLCATAPRGAVA